MDQGGETADEVDAHRMGCPIHGLGKDGEILRLTGPAYQGDGSDGNALIDNGNAQFPLDGFAGGNQFLRMAADFVVDFLGAALGVGVGAVQQT